jgi:hypothetical protein
MSHTVTNGLFQLELFTHAKKFVYPFPDYDDNDKTVILVIMMLIPEHRIQTNNYCLNK